MLNPHNWLSKISPYKWKCNYCHRVGTLKELDKIACDHVYKPCKYCGQTPICAPDCKGIEMIFKGNIPKLEN